jgi:hypothetical protein
MFPPPAGATVVHVIEIWLDAGTPPSGRVVIAPGEEPKPFDGWLQLLRILGDAFAPEPPSGPAAASG